MVMVQLMTWLNFALRTVLLLSWMLEGVAERACVTLAVVSGTTQVFFRSSQTFGARPSMASAPSRPRDWA